MKTIQSYLKHLLCMLLLGSSILSAQTTNTFPASGNVGIGTVTPSSALQVVGDSKLDGNLLLQGNSVFQSDIRLSTMVDSNATFTRVMGLTPNGKVVNASPSRVLLHYLKVDSAMKVGDSSLNFLGSTGSFPHNHIFGTHGALVINGISGTIPENTFFNSFGGQVGVGYNPANLPNSSKFCVNGNSFLSGFSGINTAPIAGTRLGIVANAHQVGLQVSHLQTTPYGYAINDIVKNAETKAFTVTYDNGLATKETFQVLGNGVTNIGLNAPYQTNAQVAVETGLDVGCKVKLTSAVSNANQVGLMVDVPYVQTKAISIINSNPNNYPIPREVFRVSGNGVAWMQELRVRVAPFPDYVFEEEYNLMDLDSLESFISANHRLPGMPSAAEVAENDANVGELVRLQQEKIEELTLHVIALSKKLEGIKNDNH